MAEVTGENNLPREHPNDEMARKWAARLRKDKAYAREVMRQFRIGRLDNYVVPDLERWNPTVSTAGGESGMMRKMVKFSDDSRWGLESLRAGLELASDIDEGSSVMNAMKLCLVPYPRFTADGEVDPDSSLVLLFTQDQVAKLRQVIK